MVVHLNWLGTLVHTVHDDHDDVVGRGEIDIVHDQHLTITEARLGMDVGLPHGFGASLVLPLRLISTTIEYFDTDGMAVELTEPGIHHRNENVTGLGDPMLLGWYGRALGDWRITGRAGLSIPLGDTEEDPFALGDQGLAHQHIQMGTGTVNPIVAAEVTRTWGPWQLGGFAFTQQVFYANTKGYQAGDRYAGGLSLRRTLARRWQLRGGAEVQAESAERWNGIVHTDDGNQGRVDVMIAGGVSWKVAGPLSVNFAIKVPVVTHVVGGQLEMPAIVELGASWSFGGPPRPAPHEDEHDHGDEHEHGEHEHDEHGEHDEHEDVSGLDIAELPEPAPGVEFVPVPGKMTIIDVWATWCEPCKTLEPVLVDMVRAHPDTMALRRVDVTDSDEWSLKLPHVRVFDASGKKVLEVSSDGNLDALIDAVRAVVEP